MALYALELLLPSELFGRALFARPFVFASVGLGPVLAAKQLRSAWFGPALEPGLAVPGERSWSLRPVE